MERIDRDPDPFVNGFNRVRDPKRLDSRATMVSTQMERRIACRVRGDSFTNWTIANNTSTALDWVEEEFDTAGVHSNTTNKTRLTIPTTGLITGLWILHGVVRWFGNATGARQVRIWRNGSDIGGIWESPGNVDIFSQQITRFILDPNAGDYYELAVVQTSGGNLNVSATGEETYFELIHLW